MYWVSYGVILYCNMYKLLVVNKRDLLFIHLIVSYMKTLEFCLGIPKNSIEIKEIQLQRTKYSLKSK